ARSDVAGVTQQSLLVRAANPFSAPLDGMGLSLFVAVDQVPDVLHQADGVVRVELATALTCQVLHEFLTRSRPLLWVGAHGPTNGPVGPLGEVGCQLPGRRDLVVDLLHPGVEGPARLEG